MVEKFQKKLSDSPAMRWTALVLLATAMFFGYIFVDILSPLMDLLQTQRVSDQGTRHIRAVRGCVRGYGYHF